MNQIQVTKYVQKVSMHKVETKPRVFSLKSWFPRTRNAEAKGSQVQG